MPAVGLNFGCRHGTLVSTCGFVAARRLHSRCGGKTEGRRTALQEAQMGLLDILNGMQNGPHGNQSQSGQQSGGMSPIMMALLGLLAYKAFKGGSQSAPSMPTSGGGGLGDILGGLLGGGRPSGVPSGTPSGMPSPGGSGGLGDILAGGLGGSVLSGGLGDLIK